MTVVVSLKRWRKERRPAQPVEPDYEPLRWHWLLSNTGVLAIVITVAGFGVAMFMWMLNVAGHAPDTGAANKSMLRIEAIKYGLGSIAAGGAVAALMLAIRRQVLSERAQRHAEQAQRFSETDALEQRTTALYVAAANQLGSDKAAVRLAGLYALERLGQDEPKLRQTVVDVLCSYLRMPYTPPAEVLQHNDERSPDRLAEGAEPLDGALESERRQELQVRLTAQRLLAAHMSRDLAKAGEATYWLDHRGNRMVVDLVGAVLVDFTLNSCDVGRCNLSDAQFHGVADFAGVQFHADTYLTRTRFHGGAVLHGAQFYGNALLPDVQFHGDALLGEAQFHGDAVLRRAKFYGGADLSETRFHRNADLTEAQFHGDADLSDTRFHGDAIMHGAQFHSTAGLAEAQFHGDAVLRWVTFHGDAFLTDAQFYRGADLSRAKFCGDTDLSEARFHSSLDMQSAMAVSSVVVPAGWKLSSAPVQQGELQAVISADKEFAEQDGSGEPNVESGKSLTE